MKVISIGRGTDCQIVFDEPTISRRHAILKIYPWGKMELVDMGQNGTFVNGVKLSSNVPYPVTRKDVISFAHVRQLDWNMVPDPLRFVKWGLLAAIGIAVLIGVIVFVKSLDKPAVPEQEVPEEVQSGNKPVDKSGVATPEQKEDVKEEEELPKLVVPNKKDKSKKKPEKKEKPKEEQPKEESQKTTPVYV